MKSINQYIQEKLVLTKDIINKNTKKNYLQFKAIEDSIISIDNNTDPNIEYSFDCKEWIEWDYSDIKLNKGQIVYIRGDNPKGFNISIIVYNKFVMTGKLEASGNIMSLLYKNNFENKLEIPYKCCFFGLFTNCEVLITPPELPATKLTKWCYSIMFYGCTSLTQAPELPATTLADYCYTRMFYGCTSLTQAPELPATTLAEGCYNEMFNGCTTLTKKLNIDADINNNNCKDMFKDCPCEKD